jgi:hypothetical protein
VEKNLRYNVTNFDKIEAWIDRGRTEEKLMTISSEGCGFYGLTPDPHFRINRILTCSFKMKDEPGQEATKPVDVPGNLLYIKTIETGEREAYLYGIEFLETHKTKIVPIIKILEELAAKGVIEVVTN